MKIDQRSVLTSSIAHLLFRSGSVITGRSNSAFNGFCGIAQFLDGVGTPIRTLSLGSKRLNGRDLILIIRPILLNFVGLGVAINIVHTLLILILLFCRVVDIGGLVISRVAELNSLCISPSHGLF